MSKFVGLGQPQPATKLLGKPHAVDWGHQDFTAHWTRTPDGQIMEQTPVEQLLEKLAHVQVAPRLRVVDVASIQIRVSCTRHMDPASIASLRYTIGDYLVHEVLVAPHFLPPAGFRHATETELSCMDCQAIADDFLRRRGWCNDPVSGEICRKCLRSPVEYFLAHTPEHAVWFERSVMLARKGGV